MPLAHRWIDRNLSRLELVVALIIIISVIGIFMRHLQLVFARAEMSMVNTTIINLNSSLKYQAAMAVMRSDYEQLSNMDKMNPVSEIQSLQNGYGNIEETLELVDKTAAYPVFNKPVNYIGELVKPQADTLQRGVWYFDPSEKTLNYHPSYSGQIIEPLDSDNIISFRVSFQYSDINADGRYNPEIDRFLSIGIVRVNDHKG